jgi:hypothetical protein
MPGPFWTSALTCFACLVLHTLVIRLDALRPLSPAARILGWCLLCHTLAPFYA